MNRRKLRLDGFAILAMVLFVSAFLRLMIGAQDGAAFAATVKSGMSEAVETVDAPQELLSALLEREHAVDEAEKMIQQKRQALDLARKEVEAQIAALETAEARLRETMSISSSAAENDLSMLTAVYENMKPKEAALLFETMEPEFAAGFIGRMDAVAAAGIMAGLSPETAYTISVVLAGRNALAATE